MAQAQLYVEVEVQLELGREYPASRGMSPVFNGPQPVVVRFEYMGYAATGWDSWALASRSSIQ